MINSKFSKKPTYYPSGVLYDDEKHVCQVFENKAKDVKIFYNVIQVIVTLYFIEFRHETTAHPTTIFKSRVC